MTDAERDRLATWAVMALTAISTVAVIGGVTMTWLGFEVEGVTAIVSGAVGGIVAIVVQGSKSG